jgi:hypothetical protein
MGKVIAFRPRQQAARAPSKGGDAQILFFTGVRYQRHDPEAGSPAPERPSPQVSRGGGRRRRRG